jgi:hypothetical protein
MERRDQGEDAKAIKAIISRQFAIPANQVDTSRAHCRVVMH